MKTQAMFNIQEFLTFIKNLQEQLPPDSPMAKQLQEQTQQWLSTVMAALACLDDAESQAVIQQIKPFLLNLVQQQPPICPSPVEEDLQKTAKRKTTKAKKATQKDSDKPVVPNQAELNEISPPQPVEPPPNHSGNDFWWQQLADENALLPNNHTAQKAELCRWYSWRLVNAKNGKELHDLINQWKTLSSEQQPQPNDIVVYCPVPQALSKEVSSSLWIGEASLFPEFAQNFDDYHHSAQVWLTFQEPIERYQSLEQFQWFNDHSDTLPLWRRWYDLRHWAILAPDVAAVFVNNRSERLSEQREAIGNKLSKIQQNLVARLQQPTEYIHIAENLHLIYAAFYQFLLPEDVASKYPEHLFAALRTAANDNLKKSWLSALDIEELHDAGFPKKTEYVAGVYKDTDKSVIISKSHQLLTDKNIYEADKVLYWLSPKWKQHNPPTQRAELLGNVLYCD